MAEMAHFAKFAFAPDEVNDLTPTVICERVQEGAEMDEAAKVNIGFGQGSACASFIEILGLQKCIDLHQVTSFGSRYQRYRQG
ncbi:hypothetical protein PTI98_002002 [Pleurotus ostreatus]|nr:hypothetical protein PTI98_002002 [Pleurotus ostreatus]